MVERGIALHGRGASRPDAGVESVAFFFFFFGCGMAKSNFAWRRVGSAASQPRHLQAGTLGPAIRHRTRDSAQPNIGAKETLGKPPIIHPARPRTLTAIHHSPFPPDQGATSGGLRDALLCTRRDSAHALISIYRPPRPLQLSPQALFSIGLLSIMTCPFAKFAGILPASAAHVRALHGLDATVSDTNAQGLSLSEALRVGTARSHRAVEKSRGVSLLLQTTATASDAAHEGLSFDRTDYTRFNIMLACIYT